MNTRAVEGTVPKRNTGARLANDLDLDELLNFPLDFKIFLSKESDPLIVLLPNSRTVFH